MTLEERFMLLVNRPGRTCDELKNLYYNAQSRHEPACADLAKEALDERCPRWDKKKSGAASKQTALARLRKETYSGESSEEAYVWLLEQFMDEGLNILAGIEFETVYLPRGKKRLVAGDTKRLDFARSPAALFKESSSLALDPNNYVHLSNGWYANLTLSRLSRLNMLSRYGAFLEIPRSEWHWQLEQPTGEIPNAERSENPFAPDPLN